MKTVWNHHQYWKGGHYGTERMTQILWNTGETLMSAPGGGFKQLDYYILYSIIAIQDNLLVCFLYSLFE